MPSLSIHVFMWICRCIRTPCILFTKTTGLIPCLVQSTLTSMLWSGLFFCVPLVAKVTWAHITSSSQGSSNMPPRHHLSYGMQLNNHSPFITAQTKPLVLVSHNTTGPIFANICQLCGVTEASLPWCICTGFSWMPLCWGCRFYPSVPLEGCQG